MKQPRIFQKVALDMFWAQFQWALGFLGIMLGIHIFRIVTSFMRGTDVDTYFNMVFVAANIFIFILGIICMNFLKHYVGNGVTRKDYFKGGLIASLGLSIVLPIITLLVSAVSQLVIGQIDRVTINEPNINSVVLDIELDGNIIGNIISSVVQSFVVPPYVDPNGALILALGIVSLNVFIYYLIGWMIHAGFYRLGTLGGLGFVLVGVVTLILKDTLLRIILDLPIAEMVQFLDFVPQSVAGITVFLLMMMLIGIIRTLTKRAMIKI
ncbi:MULTISPECIES: hypothetical protein [Bacillaceae]|uniref:Uncharacterized protein n=1 Tax=Evansella alkalicola TaxID=745819 RepID=A0ABS6K037_9BACI|nr:MULTISPECIES: hypothetical protein [Bacillaceae]MBU9723299.1 hypothetical protein [Bacillus alkalicola]